MRTIFGDTGHRGSYEPGIGQPQDDFRITDLIEELLRLDPRQQADQFVEDPFSTIALNRQRFSESNPLVTGTVTQSIPCLNWYRVQAGGGGTAMPAMMLSESSFLPIGVRSTSPIPPNSNVLLFIPPGMHFAIILGVIPEALQSGEVSMADWLQQGGNTGFKRDQAHKKPFELNREGGIIDWSSQRPVDSTSMEWGKMAETGVGIMIDPYQAYLRVNEACGIFMNYFDSYLRLSAIQYDFQTYCQHLIQRNDEGENVSIAANFIYPWEATGCYNGGEAFCNEFDDKAVQYDLPKGKLDLDDGEEDLQPVMRCVDYGGYLGQGYQRFVMAPSTQNGKRLYSDEAADNGLFHEHIALDGSVTMRSAKSIYFGKRNLIPIPKRIHIPEDQQNGDDARKDNYKFSSKFGGGTEHKVSDVKVEGEDQQLLRVAGILDLLAYNYNWKGLHPFHYHEGDYQLLDESDMDVFDRTTDQLDFGSLASADYMSDPTPKQLNIDHRYNNVDYYQRESYLAFLDDGGIVMGDGCGSELVMTGGNVTLTAPGNISVMPGKRAVIMGWDCVVRAKNSVDISASEKDVRLKAERNMQLLAGNSGQGGMLLQSKSTSKAHIYQNKYGEDVVSSGIVSIAKHSENAMLGGEVYIRTGGGDMRDGRITIDASKGREDLLTYSRTVNMFNSRGVNIWHAPTGESANMTKSHSFTRFYSKIDGDLIVERNACITDGDLFVAKNIGARGNIVTEKQLSQKASLFVGPHEGKISYKAAIDQYRDSREKHVEQGERVFDRVIKRRWYEEERLGNDTQLEAIGFSFRDPPGSPVQYKAEEFKMAEPRWQQYVRNGMGSGGTAWTEKPVIYNGTQTYPFPGRQKWTEEPTMLAYQEHTLFDSGSARSKNRGEDYEEPELSSWEPQTPDGNFKTIL